MTQRRLPPYARQMGERITRGRLIWIAIGPDAWDYAKRRLASRPGRIQLVCPVDDNPLGYNWTLVRDHMVMLERAGSVCPEHLMSLVKALVRDGASVVRDTWSGREYIGRNLLDA